MSNILTPYRYAGGGLAGIISYWKLDSNSNDFVGSNNGTDTSISYVTGGVIDDCADFSSSTSSEISIADSDTLSFGNGTTDSPFSVSLWVKRTSATPATIYLFSKKGTGEFEYEIYWSNNQLRFRLWDNSAFSRIEYRTGTGTLANLDEWYNVVGTYDGSGVIGGLNVYENGFLSASPNGNVGTYVAMENGTAPVVFGKNNLNTTNSLDGEMDEIYLFNRELTPTEAEFCYDEGLAGRTLI